MNCFAVLFNISLMNLPFLKFIFMKVRLSRTFRKNAQKNMRQKCTHISKRYEVEIEIAEESKAGVSGICAFYPCKNALFLFVPL
ncbi:hypothetical protein D3Z38_05920 [Clostridiales bacterium]|nr:hypothetical protein [Clostridiales bacterium]